MYLQSLSLYLFDRLSGKQSEGFLSFDRSDVVLRSKGTAASNCIQTHWLSPSSLIVDVM